MSISPAWYQQLSSSLQSSVDDTGCWPETTSKHPQCWPYTADIGGHVREVKDEQAMGPALKRHEPNAGAAEIGARVQELCGIHTP